MAFVVPPGSYIRDIPGYGQVAFSPNHRPLGIVLNSTNLGALIGRWDGLGSRPGDCGSGESGGFRGHGSGNRGGWGVLGRLGNRMGGRGQTMTQMRGIEGRGVGGMRGGCSNIVRDGVGMTDHLGRGGYGGGYPTSGAGGPGSYPGGWGGYNSYPMTRLVDPSLDFVPGGPRGTPGHYPVSSHPDVPIDPRDDARGITSKKLRDAPEKLKEEDLPADGKDCSICYTPFWEKPASGGPEAPVKLRSCGHVFGENCLNEWVQTNNSCPSCRKEFPVLRMRQENSSL